MADTVVHAIPFPRNSIARSNALLAPTAGSVFLTVLPVDLPSGYYMFDTIVAISPNAGSGNGNIVDTRNFVIAIDGFADFIPQAVLNFAIKTTGYLNLNGSQSITLKVGASNASSNMIYSISIFLTKLG